MKDIIETDSVNVTLVCEQERIEAHKVMMKNSTKIGLKRKIELVDSKPDKVTAVGKKKAPLKADVMIQLKDLQDKFDTLEIKNKENLISLEEANKAIENFQEVIRFLKGTIYHLEKKKEMLSKETQTEIGIGLNPIRSGI